jgi:carboxypeptidase Q
MSAQTMATIALTTMALAAMAMVAPAGQVASPSDAPDLRVYARIRDEGQNRSRVMDYATELIDGIGPRLTGSPNLKKATAWAQERLTQMGLSSVRAESWGEFGVGWEQRNVWARMIAPDTATLIAYAAPWSPATPGAISADIVNVGGLEDAAAVARFSGKLRGKFVLLARAPGPPDVKPFDKPLFTRLTNDELTAYAAPRPEAADAPANPGAADATEQMWARVERYEAMGRALAAEGVLAIVVPSGNRPNGGISGGTLLVDGNAALGALAYKKDRLMQAPLVVIANEHYGRIERLLERDVPVKLELNVDTAFTGDREEGFNVLGEIPGVDPARRDQVVMVGAHLDSWAAGTGATDDGAGVLIAMEAMRLLRAVGVQPRRTIRIALWSGEEQGALGSLDYVKRHIATAPRATTPDALRVPELMRRRSGPMVPKADHARLSALFTLDAGGGRIRGISVGANPALVPMFKQWSAPLEELGMTMVAARSDCGGDCRPFAEAGIPALVFRHDPLDYDTRTHHTNMDTYEHLIPDDLRQAAIIVATMLYNTAMRDEMLPRVTP